jgi:hypothetical protein
VANGRSSACTTAVLQHKSDAPPVEPSCKVFGDSND